MPKPDKQQPKMKRNSPVREERRKRALPVTTAILTLSLAYANAYAQGTQKTAEQWRAYFETNEELCSDALNPEKTAWNANPDHAAYVAEAAQRGLTIDGCLHKSWETPQRSAKATGVQQDDDVLEKAFNYVLVGDINGDPQKIVQVQIIDRKECIVTKSAMGLKMTYYFRRMKPDTAEFIPYSSPYGTGASIALQIEGDEPIMERGDGEKSNRATIIVAGELERTKRALQLIFSQYCPPESTGLPF